MKHRITGMAAILLAAACAAPGPATYGPVADGRYGYEEMRIETDRYRVVYRGSGGMPPEMVEDYALRRAAEIALISGFDWFRITARDLSHEERGGVSIGAGVGSGSYGRHGGFGVGVGGDFGRVGAQDYFTSRIEILLGKGPTPDDPEVYDAAEVLDPYLRPEEERD